ncbi:MATE family efflux transporter [Natranaerobius thermophilus]|uniref:Probable multidrug resistance protein NorM n=1 Tax=Natranaerobius thermophilus (strain ATCC BAA-1301 / DSM 18059 / JW/NM-WN-LF) TaxID=457570 RepID=B2A8H3_NATTJ|nr:MATE family efflux transporter [Natranaerobius thermophilus]ACB85857.1 MATE efflux family protein [Natranaerobius thermophilus JW/NM-WN-LF]
MAGGAQLAQQNKRDLTTGSIPKKLIRLALPIMGGMFLQTIFNIVDTFFVSQLGHNAIAAVSMNMPILFILIAMGNAVAVGTSSYIARSIGAGEDEKARKTASQAITLAVILGIVATIIGVSFAPYIISFMGAEGELYSLAVEYTSIIFWGNLIFFLFLALDGVLRGEGDMKTSMMKQVVGVGFNILLDPIFIFGLGPVPAMGVAGAALAIVLSRFLGLLFLVWHFSTGRSTIKFNMTKFVFESEIIKQIMAVGLPTSASQAMMSLTLFVYNRLASGFGDEAVAALGLGFRIDSLAILPGIAIGISMVTMVGQNYGAGELERVRRSYWTAQAMAAGFMASVGVFLFAFPEFFIGIFSQEQDVMSHGVSYLRILPIFYPFLGSGLISAHSFQGLGKAIPALIISLIRVGLVGIPLALFLTSQTGLGASGIWLALGLSDFTFFGVGMLWFKSTFKRMTRFVHS